MPDYVRERVRVYWFKKKCISSSFFQMFSEWKKVYKYINLEGGPLIWRTCNNFKAGFQKRPPPGAGPRQDTSQTHLSPGSEHSSLETIKTFLYSHRQTPHRLPFWWFKIRAESNKWLHKFIIVAIEPNARHNYDRTMTGWSSVRILWLGGIWGHDAGGLVSQ